MTEDEVQAAVDEITDRIADHAAMDPKRASHAASLDFLDSIVFYCESQAAALREELQGSPTDECDHFWSTGGTDGRICNICGEIDGASAMEVES